MFSGWCDDVDEDATDDNVLGNDGTAIDAVLVVAVVRRNI